MEDSPILEVSGLSVEFDGRVVLENVSFKVYKGEVMAIVGPNGAGKSTIFRALLDLIPYQGKVSWGEKIKIGYVPQKLALERDMPLTVMEFLKLKDSSGSNIHKVLKRVGIHEHIQDIPVGVISGGELQRVLIAWALLGNPNVLLFDEPTSGIDLGGEETIYNLLHKLQGSDELTILLISHDLNVVYQYADNVLCLNKQIVCFGQPNSVLDPKGLAELYGGEAKFFRHDHERNHHHGN